MYKKFEINAEKYIDAKVYTIENRLIENYFE